MTKLAYDEVKTRVLSAHADVVDDLCQLGETLVRDGVDRLAKYDGKATAIAAYCAGLVTLSMSTISLWGPKVSGILKLSAALGILGFLIAAWLAVVSTFPSDTEWHSDDDWLRSECLGDRDKMRRYRVLTMWKIVTSLEIAYKRRSTRLSYAMHTMEAALVLLFLAFLQVAWRVAAL